MHSEAIGSVWTFSNFFEICWIFESFFEVSGRNFYKRLFHGTISREIDELREKINDAPGLVKNVLT